MAPRRDLLPRPRAPRLDPARQRRRSIGKAAPERWPWSWLGDRRATAGNLIASRDIEKVFASDDYSLVGIAGTAGIAVEIVRLYQVELEHYEKIEGTQLTLEGKARPGSRR